MNRFSSLLPAVGLFAACVSPQSARIVAPGKIQVGVGVTRMTVADDEDVAYAGELRVAYGVNDSTEIGLEYARTAGTGEANSSLSVSPKFQISRTDTSAVSLAVPVSLWWGENSLDDVGGGTFALFPTLYAGFDVSKNAELVIAPRVGIANPVGGDNSAFGVGLSLGLRIGDSTTRSAIEPSLGFLRLNDFGGNGDGATFLLFGLGVTAGD